MATIEIRLVVNPHWTIGRLMFWPSEGCNLLVKICTILNNIVSRMKNDTNTPNDSQIVDNGQC